MYLFYQLFSDKARNDLSVPSVLKQATKYIIIIRPRDRSKFGKI